MIHFLAAVGSFGNISGLYVKNNLESQHYNLMINPKGKAVALSNQFQSAYVPDLGPNNHISTMPSISFTINGIQNL